MDKILRINNRDYSGIPKVTSIVICLDGSQKEYLEEASKSNMTPMIDKIIQKIMNDPEPIEVKEIELQLWDKIQIAARNGRRTTSMLCWNDKSKTNIVFSKGI